MYPGSRFVSPAPWINRACFVLVGVGVGAGEGEERAAVREGRGERVASVLVPSGDSRISALASVPAPAAATAPRVRRKVRLLSLRGGLSSLTAGSVPRGGEATSEGGRPRSVEPPQQAIQPYASCEDEVVEEERTEDGQASRVRGARHHESEGVDGEGDQRDAGDQRGRKGTDVSHVEHERGPREQQHDQESKREPERRPGLQSNLRARHVCRDAEQGD